ncbi:MAG TPA: DivIVA domain-containing protein [Pseudonocardiaceae bacterium]|nr:DivIVA domain-containing protein [Pseudonocardiaceae bacterium]
MQPSEQGGPSRRWRASLTPERVRTTAFSRSSLARRGYDVEEVQLFLQRVAEDIAARETEKGKLRAEINRLRDWYKKRGHDVDATREASQAYAKAQAVQMLSDAQLQVEAYVAQAQSYSRRVAVEARQQAELVLRDAQERADAASETAAKDYRYNSGGGYAAELEEMERRVAWLRAFCHAIQVQLHAATDAFSREVDKLSQFPASGAARREEDAETTSTELRVYAPDARNGWHG